MHFQRFHIREKGKSDGEIISKLRKSGWKLEQIRYAIRKYAGKRTGMFELPIGRVLDKLKKKGVLDKDKARKNVFNGFSNKGRGFVR